ncbi:hypothetical protein LQD23_12620 [Chromobacterium violaceum]|uniref:hypothetical protein n=1 Tax=Chromobacterium violaceum TaxID=536 RepID=UPI001E28E151|nr:hypothetical protein [Chromobacterium violaceum]MCD0493136.1 hypothetical protein [Chromobacterium violaceum]
MYDKRDWNYNITLHSADHQHDDWEKYYSQYKFIVTMAFETAWRGSCTGIYIPLLFLIRHTLEIGYKTNLRFLNTLLDPEEKTAYSNDHKLEKLHEKFKETVEKINKKKDLPQGFMNEFESQVTKLEKFKDSLHAIDSGSTTFRYPEKVNGNPSIENPTIINLIDIKEAFDDATTVLTFTHDVITDYLHLKTQRAP